MDVKNLYPGIGRRCRHARKEYHLTQKDIADRLNMSAQAVSSFERGVMGSMDLLIYYVVYLGVRLDGVQYGS